MPLTIALPPTPYLNAGYAVMGNSLDGDSHLGDEGGDAGGVGLGGVSSSSSSLLTPGGSTERATGSITI